MAKSTTGRFRTKVWLTIKQHAQLMQVCKADGITPSELVERRLRRMILEETGKVV